MENIILDLLEKSNATQDQINYTLTNANKMTFQAKQNLINSLKNNLS